MIPRGVRVRQVWSTPKRSFGVLENRGPLYTSETVCRVLIISCLLEFIEEGVAKNPLSTYGLVLKGPRRRPTI